MHRVADYLKRADNADAAARQISLQPAKEQLLAIAAEWRHLAQQAADLAAYEKLTAPTKE